MRITFRQGIIEYPTANNDQAFLLRQGNSVTLSVDNGPVSFTAAHGAENYLFVEPFTVSNAWIDLEFDIDYWLYWDINLLTGTRTFGYTKLQPWVGNEKFYGRQIVEFSSTTNNKSPITLLGFEYLSTKINGYDKTFAIDGTKCVDFNTLVVELQKAMKDEATVSFDATTHSISFNSLANSSNSSFNLYPNNFLTNLPGYVRTLDPVVIADTPPKLVDQHWFDTKTQRMYVYHHDTWNTVARVFAAKVNNYTFNPVGRTFETLVSNGNITAIVAKFPFAGSQVGLNTNDTDIEPIALDYNNLTVPKIDNTLFTYATNFTQSNSPIDQIRLESNTVIGRSKTHIPKYTVVDMTDVTDIKPVSVDNIKLYFIGMLVSDAKPGADCSICVNGVVYNKDWSFTHIGSPIWIHPNNALYTTPPVNNTNPPIAWSLSPTSMLFKSSFNDRVIANELIVPDASVTTLGTFKLSVDAVDIHNPIIVGDNDPRLVAYVHPFNHSSDIIITQPYSIATATTLTEQLKQLTDINLYDLSDLNITSTVSSQWLEFDGTNWVNVNIPYNQVNLLNDFMDVVITTPKDKLDYTAISGVLTEDKRVQTIQFNGVSWVNNVIQTGGCNNLYDILNVELTAPRLNDLLSFTGAYWTNLRVNLYGIHTLSDVPDVVLTKLTKDQALVYDGHNWINKSFKTIKFIDDLLDVAVVTPLDNQILVYDSAIKLWVNQTIKIPSKLTDLDDVMGKAPMAANDVLQFDGHKWSNVSLDKIVEQVLDSITKPCMVEIQGPSIVNESTITEYKAFLVYNNCTTQDLTLTANWSVITDNNNNVHGSVEKGSFFSPVIATDAVSKITASTTVNGVVYSATKNVVINDVKNIIKMQIVGATIVRENSSVGYVYELTLDDNSKLSITDDGFWTVLNEDDTVSSITMTGSLFVAPEVTTDLHRKIKVQYNYRGTVIESVIDITIVNAVVLERILILGDSTITELETKTYGVKLIYSDGTSRVTTTNNWSVSIPSMTTTGTMNNGIYTAPEVQSNTAASITAVYTHNGTDYTDHLAVTIYNSAKITNMVINGPSTAKLNQITTYTITVSYDDHTTQLITNNYPFNLMWSLSSATGVLLDNTGTLTVSNKAIPGTTLTLTITDTVSKIAGTKQITISQ